jgi:hypothetical protein
MIVPCFAVAHPLRLVNVSAFNCKRQREAQPTGGDCLLQRLVELSRAKRGS